MTTTAEIEAPVPAIVIKSVDVELGACLAAPAWTNHPRAKNWLAVIHKDPLSPGGLGRAFCQRAHGEYYYMVAHLKPGDALECGADSLTRRGHRNHDRHFRVVHLVTESEIVWEVARTGRKAIARGEEIRALLPIAKALVEAFQMLADRYRDG